MMHKHKIERVLVLNEKDELKGLITVKDILKTTEFPNANKDAEGRLRVGAAVGTGGDTEERVKALVEAGVDVIVVDTAHGHSQGVIERVKWVKETYPHIQVIGGNIATAKPLWIWSQQEQTPSKSVSVRVQFVPPVSLQA